jgi:hypothetical protein
MEKSKFEGVNLFNFKRFFMYFEGNWQKIQSPVLFCVIKIYDMCSFVAWLCYHHNQMPTLFSALHLAEVDCSQLQPKKRSGSWMCSGSSEPCVVLNTKRVKCNYTFRYLAIFFNL